MSYRHISPSFYIYPPVYASYRRLLMRKVTVTYSIRDRDTVPMIRLRGKWLKGAGFEEGQLVHVDIATGKLTLVLVTESVPE